jgi:uncharacterized membrane protein YkoI
MNPVRKFVIAGAVVGVGLLGVAVGATTLGTASAAADPPATTAGAASTATTTPSEANESTSGIDASGPHQANGITETPLTGDDLAKATAAAQAAVPGATVDRAETDADGATYEVHMTKTDGTHVTVELDANFAVTGTETGGGGGGDHGAGGHRDGETALTGDDLAKATAAAQAAVPGGTVERAETDADGATYEVHMTKTDGTHVTVELDANFAVTGTVTGNG